LRTLTAKEHDRIVRLGKQDFRDVAIAEKVGRPLRVVRKVLAANGLTNSKPEVVERDKGVRLEVDGRRPMNILERMAAWGTSTAS
jgi:hypothetical protein